MSKNFTILIGIFVVAAAASFAVLSKSDKNPIDTIVGTTNQNNSPSGSAIDLSNEAVKNNLIAKSSTVNDLVKNPAPVATQQAPSAPASIENIEVVYSDNGFSPSTVTIKKGSTVIFRNESSGSMWPATNPHPAHTDYPAPGACAATMFDACRAVAKGGSWSFVFNAVGSWGYHDHIKAKNKGVIVVQ